MLQHGLREAPAVQLWALYCRCWLQQNGLGTFNMALLSQLMRA